MKEYIWKDPHMIRSVRSILKGLFLSVGFFLLVFVVTHIVGTVYTSFLAEKSADKFQAGITSDLNHLKKEGDAIAKDERVINSLLLNDTASLLAILQAEKVSR